MNTRLVLAAVAAVTLTAGCTPRVRLPMRALSPEVLARVEVEDVRAPQDRETFRTTSDALCARSYGDEFVEPGSVAYLRALVAERAPLGATLRVRIERLDTMERCERWIKRYKKAGWGGTLGKLVSVPVAKDTFTLQFVGSVNGAPIRFRAGFEYEDAEYAGYPPEGSASYRSRLARIFGELANAIVKPNADFNAPAVDIVDLRAIHRARGKAADEAAKQAASEGPPGA